MSCVKSTLRRNALSKYPRFASLANLFCTGARQSMGKLPWARWDFPATIVATVQILYTQIHTASLSHLRTMLPESSSRPAALACHTAQPRNLVLISLETPVLGPKLIFVTGLVKFVTAVARLVCPDLLG